MVGAILDKAGRHVAEYEQTFKSLVTEENYTQWENRGGGLSRRIVRSDLVFTTTPGPIPWTSFRDVYEVDGQKVREREARLEKLFLHFKPNRALARLSVECRPEPGLDIWVPSEMKERYEDMLGTSWRVFGGTIEGSARYSNYRRFSGHHRGEGGSHGAVRSRPGPFSMGA